jgi:4-amino-4-deoxy-L-arabinose transferase-like glycosyltransferase
MPIELINRTSRIVLIVLSLTALLAVLWGYTQPPQPDEGTGAHIFQLSVVLGALAMFLVLGTADWTQPSHIMRRLVIPVAAFVLAFAALYYMENHYYPAHYPPVVRTDR